LGIVPEQAAGNVAILKGCLPLLVVRGNFDFRAARVIAPDRAQVEPDLGQGMNCAHIHVDRHAGRLRRIAGPDGIGFAVHHQVGLGALDGGGHLPAIARDFPEGALSAAGRQEIVKYGETGDISFLPGAADAVQERFKIMGFDAQGRCVIKATFSAALTVSRNFTGFLGNRSLYGSDTIRFSCVS